MPKVPVAALLALVITLGLAASINLWWPYLSPIIDRIQPTEASQVFALDRAEITAISLRIDAQNQVDLTRTETGWKLNEFPADTRQIERLLDALTTDQPDNLATTNAAAFERLGIAEASQRVTVSTADSQRVFVLGNSSVQPGMYYLQVEGESQVWQVKGQLKNLMSLKAIDWRDKTLVRLQPDAYDRVEVQTPSGAIVITKQADNTWQATSGRRSTTVGSQLESGIVETLRSLSAIGLGSVQDEDVFRSGRKQTLKVSRGEEVLVTMSFVQATGTWLAMLEGNPELYTVPAAAVEKLLLTPTQVFVE